MELVWYSPEAVRTADGTEVRIVESFYPRHRATKHWPARSFRFAGRAFTEEEAWGYLRRRPAQHRILTPLNRSEHDRG